MKFASQMRATVTPYTTVMCDRRKRTPPPPCPNAGEARKFTRPDKMGAAATKPSPKASIPPPLALGQPVSNPKIDVQEKISNNPGKLCQISENEHDYGMTELVGWRKRQGITSFRELHAEPERNSVEFFQVYYAAIFRLKYSVGGLEQRKIDVANIVGSERPVPALQLSDSKSELRSLQVDHYQPQHPTVSSNSARSVLEAALDTTPNQLQTRYDRWAHMTFSVCEPCLQACTCTITKCIRICGM